MLWFAAAMCSSAPAARGAEGLRISWTNNMLTLRRADLPGGKIDVWYLEAFCRSGGHEREWNQTTLPHRTQLVSADKSGKKLTLRSRVADAVEVEHDIKAAADEVDFRVKLHNAGAERIDVDWFQPCMRVGQFTGLAQSNYISRSFIFTAQGLTWLDKTRRTEEARYRGGQVYVPAVVPLQDVNPRPISPDRPVNGLIGCVSSDGKWMLAMAWDHTEELFQGVIICLHNDPRVGGLGPGETKELRGKIYLLRNDAQELLRRYRKDFGGSSAGAQK